METLATSTAAIVQAAKVALELTGAVIVALGGAAALADLIRGAVVRRPPRFTAVRLGMARYLALGLEFQLAADILNTALAPSWDEIGELAAIAAIRTALNYFLAREMREERDTLSAEAVVDEAAAPAARSGVEAPAVSRADRRVEGANA